MLKYYIKEDIDFRKALIQTILLDLKTSELYNIKPKLFLTEWYLHNSYFNLDEKKMFAEMINLCGLLPLESALYKICDEFSVEILAFDLDLKFVEEVGGINIE